MKFIAVAITAVLLIVVQSVSSAPAAPGKTPFSNLKRYSVSGTLSLPYAEINEPFRAWYDSDQSASRIDYYNGELDLRFFFVYRQLMFL
jgi:hypothetical protein